MANLLAVQTSGLNALPRPLPQVGNFLLCLLKGQTNLLFRQRQQVTVYALQNEVYVGTVRGTPLVRALR